MWWMGLSGAAVRCGLSALVVVGLIGAVPAISAAAAIDCVGNCNSDQEVTIDELVRLVDIALGLQPVADCPAGDANDDGQITIEELITAVGIALGGCPPETTPTTTGTPAGTATATIPPTATPVVSTPTPTIGPCTAPACLVPSQAGHYCCTAGSPVTFFAPLDMCVSSGACWVQTPGMPQTGYCDTASVCQVPASTPTATNTATAVVSTTPTGPTPTPTVTPTIRSCTEADAGGQCNAPGRAGQFCCPQPTPIFINTPLSANCPSSGDFPQGCWVSTPPGPTPDFMPYCDTSSASGVCQVPTSTVTTTATATGTATSSCTVTPTGSPTPTGPTPTPQPRCPLETPTRLPTGQVCRMIEVENQADEDVWIGAVGGAVEPNCVTASGTCLVSPALSDPSCLICTCQAGTAFDGTLHCPGGSSPHYSVDHNAWTCTCDGDGDCGATALCGPPDASSGLRSCFWTVPPPLKTGGDADHPWLLEKHGGTAQLCLPMPEGDSPVWWGGGVFGRTGCQLDGTQCSTADCSACPDGGCPAGVGPKNPFAQAEFTLGTTAIDYYDVTIINGANLAIEMAPLPSPTAPPEEVGAGTPTPTSDPYWCGAPGRWATAGPGTPTPALDLCSWEFDVDSIPVTPTPGRPLLLQSYFPCTSSTPYTGCGPTWTPTPTLTGTPTAPTPTATATPTGPTATAIDATATPSVTATPIPTYGVWYCTSGSATESAGQCILRCQSDADCDGTILPHCNLDSGYCECGSDADCPPDQYCGTQFIAGESYQYARLCGAFAGWWTADDICGSAGGLGPSDTYGALQCTTDLADLLGCTGQHAQSCYNTDDAASAVCGTAESGTSDCCGCGTSECNDLAGDWPAQAALPCKGNNSTWAMQAQPWIGYLKRACPTAYTYPYDDATSTFTCRGVGDQNLLGYRITFRSLAAPTRR